MRKMRSMMTALVVLTAFVLLIGCAQSGKDSAKKTEADEAVAVPVSVLTISPANLEERVEVTGTLHPSDEVTVAARFAGRIAWLIGKAGTQVRKGEVVARLDDVDQRIQVRSAEAALQAAGARLEQAEAAATQQVTATDSGIATARATVAAAKAQLQQAQTSAAALEATTQAQINAAQRRWTLRTAGWSWCAKARAARSAPSPKTMWSWPERRMRTIARITTA